MLQPFKNLVLLWSALVLAGGGLLSMCNLLSLSGLQPHHHLEKGETTPACVQQCAQHEEPEATTEAPCTDDCLLELPSVEVVEAQVLVLGTQPTPLPWTQAAPSAATGLDTRPPLRNRAPPGLNHRATSPPASGRFLL